MMHAEGVIDLPIGLRLFRLLPLPHKLGLLERLYGNALRRHGVAWVETSTGITWELDLADACDRWAVYGDYEGPRQMQWLRRWLAAGGVVVESGANRGQILLFLAPLPRVRWFAFEPVPSVADGLQACLSRYPAWPVKLIRAGLSSKQGDVSVQLDGPRSTARMDWYRDKHCPILSVPMTTLDAFMADEGINRLRLWKLDVEGHELHALQGARHTLEHKRVDAILIELSDVGSSVDLLGAYGYTLYQIAANGDLRLFDQSERPGGNLVALPDAPLGAR
jgi:FkbM family methyltransferase